MEFNDIDLEFANKNLTDFFTITDIRDPLADRSISMMKIPGKDGEHFLESTVNARRIEVDYTIEADDIRATELALAPFLDIGEPSKLKFSREPNKYFFAVIDGQVSPERISKRIAKGTLLFVCPDPYAYSETVKSFPMSTDKKITITNSGTAKTQIVYRVGVTGDCGFVSMVSPVGTILYGQPREVDAVTVPVSQRLLLETFASAGTWSSNIGKAFTPATDIEGSFGASNGKLVPTGFGTGVAWHGSTASKVFTSPAENFDAVIGFEFGTDDAAMTKGILEMTLLDEAGEIMFGQQIKDAFQGYANAVPGMFVGTEMKYTEKGIKPVQAKGKSQNYDGAYGTKVATSEDAGGWNRLFGTLEITKMGKKVTFKLTKRNSAGKVVNKLIKSFSLTTAQQAQKANAINFFFGQWQTGAVPFMAITNVVMTKHNTDKPEKIPNILQNGDKLVIDSRTSQIYKNNSLAMEHFDPFAQFHEMAPGVMVVDVQAQDLNRVTVSAEITERFL